MNSLKDFDVSDYIKDGEVLLRNLRIENCRIAGLELQNIRLIRINNCVLENVTFQNCFKYGVIISESTFIDCRFHDTINGDKSYDGVLSLRHSAFTDCLFDDVDLYVCEESSVAKCYFWNCTFKNVDITGGIETGSSFWIGGTMEDLAYKVVYIDNCEFYHMKMQHMDIGAGIDGNRFEDIKFENVTVRGRNGGNTFVDCDTDGYTFVDDDRW